MDGWSSDTEDMYRQLKHESLQIRKQNYTPLMWGISMLDTHFQDKTWKMNYKINQGILI